MKASPKQHDSSFLGVFQENYLCFPTRVVTAGKTTVEVRTKELLTNTCFIPDSSRSMRSKQSQWLMGFAISCFKSAEGMSLRFHRSCTGYSQVDWGVGWAPMQQPVGCSQRV